MESPEHDGAKCSSQGALLLGVVHGPLSDNRVDFDLYRIAVFATAKQHPLARNCANIGDANCAPSKLDRKSRQPQPLNRWFQELLDEQDYIDVGSQESTRSNPDLRWMCTYTDRHNPAESRISGVYIWRQTELRM